jgi:hypothetical protein
MALHQHISPDSAPGFCRCEDGLVLVVEEEVMEVEEMVEEMVEVVEEEERQEKVQCQAGSLSKPITGMCLLELARDV